MTTEIITRFVYDKPISPLRMSMFEGIFLESLNSQTDKDFVLVMFLHRNTADKVRNIGFGDIRVRFIIDDIPFPPDNPEPVVFQIPQEKLPNIQMRLDGDDSIADNYVASVKALWNGVDDTLINFHPMKFDYHTGNKYKHQRQYSATCPSMFLSLCQAKPSVYIYEKSHDLMHKRIKNSMYVDSNNMCWLTIHGENIFSKL